MYEYDVKQDGPRKTTSLQQDDFDHSTNDHDNIKTSGVDTKAEKIKSQDLNSKIETSTLKESGPKDIPENAPKQKTTSSKSAKEARKPLDISQCAATRASLDHTITVSMNQGRLFFFLIYQP